MEDASLYKHDKTESVKVINTAIIYYSILILFGYVVNTVFTECTSSEILKERKTIKASSELSTYLFTGVFATLDLTLIIDSQMPNPLHAFC